MPEMHETLLKKVPYIGKDLDNDGIIDTVPSQAVGPDGLPLDVVGLLTKINELHAALVVNKDAGVSINGRIMELQWLDTDTPPVLGANDRAFGVKINTTTHAMTTYYWTGLAWQEVS